jgi:hypothetical protein
MKQRKSLDLNSRVSLEALIYDDGKVELNFRVARKDYRISDEEISELYSWLGKEILGTIAATVVSKTLPVGPSGPIAAGPLAPTDPIAKTQTVNTDFDNRRAVSATAVGGLTTYPQITRADGMQMHNLSGQINKAQKAFSKEGLASGEAV